MMDSVVLCYLMGNLVKNIHWRVYIIVNVKDLNEEIRALLTKDDYYSLNTATTKQPIADLSS